MDVNSLVTTARSLTATGRALLPLGRAVAGGVRSTGRVVRRIVKSPRTRRLASVAGTWLYECGPGVVVDEVERLKRTRVLWPFGRAALALGFLYLATGFLVAGTAFGAASLLILRVPGSAWKAWLGAGTCFVAWAHLTALALALAREAWSAALSATDAWRAR